MAGDNNKDNNNKGKKPITKGSLDNKFLSAKDKVKILEERIVELEEETKDYQKHLSSENKKILELMEEKSEIQKKLQLYQDALDQPELVPWLIDKTDFYQKEFFGVLEKLDRERMTNDQRKKIILESEKYIEKIKKFNGDLQKASTSWKDYAKKLETEVKNLRGGPKKQTAKSEKGKKLEVFSEADLYQYMRIIKKNCAHLHAETAKQVKGQDKALATIQKKLIAHYSGLREDIPTVFFLHGPTGVGKTYTAEILNETLFKNLPNKPELMVLNMSEYQEKHEVSKLIGSPPGYIGYGQESKFAKHVNDNPYFSIVLLDEIEKAHPDIYHFFLHIFDKGKVEDGVGNVHNVNKYIFFLTGNIGEHFAQNKKSISGFSKSKEKETRESVIENVITSTFTPEFRNRISARIHFDFLNEETIDDILDLEFNKIVDRAIVTYNTGILMSKKAKDKIKESGFNPRTGARELKRILEDYIQGASPLISLLGKNKTVLIDYKNEQFTYTGVPSKEIKFDR